LDLGRNPAPKTCTLIKQFGLLLRGSYSSFLKKKNSIIKTRSNKTKLPHHQKAVKARKKSEPTKSTESNVPCLKETPKNLEASNLLYFFFRNKNPTKPKKPVKPINKLKNKRNCKRASVPSGEKNMMIEKNDANAKTIVKIMPTR